MKFTFFSNYLNHHQLPFCMEMKKRLGENFHFVATTPFNQARLQVGYQDMNEAFDFVVRSYQDETQYRTAIELAIDSDVIVFGSAPEKFFYQRMIRNPKGLTFRYSERLYKEKEGKINYCSIYFYWNYLLNQILSRKNVFLLASSAYAPYDYVRSGFSKEHIYQWGYFPAISFQNLESLLEKKPKRLRLIWVGRMIDWKHPEDALKIAQLLRRDGFDFELRMIGAGPMENEIQEKIQEYQLQENVICMGGLPSEKVREEMESSHIHLFTSDYNEGWGAVLNESMASACVPACSIAVGAAPFLIIHGKSGFVYECGDISGMYGFVKRLAEDPEQLKHMQINAYRQMKDHWNAQSAAKNLLVLCDSLSGKNDVNPIAYGPCAKAAFIKQANMYEFMRRG